MFNLDIKKILVLLSTIAVLSACQPGEKKQETKSEDGKQAVKSAETIKEKDKMGYALGAKMATFIGTDLDKNPELKINKDAVARGFKDGLKAQVKMTDKEIAAEFAVFQQKMQAMQQQQAAVAAKNQAMQDKNLIAEGDAFLAENGKKDGIKITESGLQYKVLTAGKKDSVKPTATDVVQVHYTGSLIDGKVFDSSVERGEPATFPLNRVIKGWTEGLQLMNVGSKYHFVIPWQLAYGAQGRPGSIPRNAVLQFEVELLAINPEAKKTNKANPEKADTK